MAEAREELSRIANYCFSGEHVIAHFVVVILVNHKLRHHEMTERVEAVDTVHYPASEASLEHLVGRCSQVLAEVEEVELGFAETNLETLEWVLVVLYSKVVEELGEVWVPAAHEGGDFAAVEL